MSVMVILRQRSCYSCDVWMPHFDWLEALIALRVMSQYATRGVCALLTFSLCFAPFSHYRFQDDSGSPGVSHRHGTLRPCLHALSRRALHARRADAVAGW